MNLTNSLELATHYLSGGNKVQLEPVYNEEENRLGIRVIVAGIRWLEEIHLDEIKQITKKFECKVYLKGDVIIYE